MSAPDELRSAAHGFVVAAFRQLADENVIPTPGWDPYIKIGRDYFGPHLNAPEISAFERAIEAAYPDRFAGERLLHREFPSSYVWQFLEACVARCGSAGDFTEIEPSVDRSIDELTSLLGSSSYEMVACRFVSHMTTATKEPIRIGDITVVPERHEDGFADERPIEQLVREIPQALTAFNREEPRPYDPPHALLITRTVTDGPDAFSIPRQLSGRLERFLLLTRLLTCGTVYSVYEVRGGPKLIARVPADFVTFGRPTLLGLGSIRIRRTVSLSGSEQPAIDTLGDPIDAIEIKREGMAATSFDIALTRFNASHIPGDPWEHLVDLSTALEAILAGGESDNEGLSLRLRTRAAALFATEADPAALIFDDVGRLYAIRSKIVHGGQIKESDLRKTIGKISTIPTDQAETAFGIAVDRAVDRLRDLVRRGILARLCLASGSDARWPYARSTPVDALLSDDATRASWRERWHEQMAEIGAADAAGPARGAVDFLSQEDR